MFYHHQLLRVVCALPPCRGKSLDATGLEKQSPLWQNKMEKSTNKNISDQFEGIGRSTVRHFRGGQFLPVAN